jgi:two-component sensor histidine kinase
MLRVSDLQCRNADAICAAAYLKRLCTELQSACLTSQGVGLSVVAPELQMLSEKICRHLGLITTELVLNAAKHAFVGCPEGEVRILLVRDARRTCLRLVVCDDGIGMHPGFDAEPHRGLGLIRLLSESIAAGCTGCTGPNGTAITLTLPLAGRSAKPERKSHSNEESLHD